MTYFRFHSDHETKPWRGVVLAFVGMIVLALIAIGVFLTSGIANQRTVTRLYTEGITVEGAVVDSRIEGEDGRAQHFVTVEYQTETAGLLRRDFLVDADDFAHATARQMIPITYLVGDEKDARVGTEFGFDMTPMFLALAALLIVLAGLAFLLVVLGVARSRRRPKFEL